METPRSPRELLPSRNWLVLIAMVFGIFCVAVPIEVAADLAQRGSRIDLFHAASLLATALVAGSLALALMRWFDRLEKALHRSG